VTAPAVRLAKRSDLPRLPEIERSAAGVFDGGDLLRSLEGRFAAAETWIPALDAGTLWVVEDGAGGVVGFLAATCIDQIMHVDELDVELDRQGQGLGRRLMQAAIAWARGRGLTGVTLTTFRDVRWNAPFYASLGFMEVAPHALCPRLGAILAREARIGLDPTQRCAMRLALK
jgi:GNAT superfamily N-acetyltransferase